MAREHHPGCGHHETHEHHHHVAELMGQAACRNGHCQHSAHQSRETYLAEQYQLAADEEYDQYGTKRKKKTVSLRKARPENVEKARLPLWQLLSTA